MQLQVGTYLNKRQYRIKSLIKRSDFGFTYLAEEVGFLKQTSSGLKYEHFTMPPQVVVIKELFPQSYCIREAETSRVYVSMGNKSDFEILARKKREEAEVLFSLDHENIIRISNYFTDNDTSYTVMKYVAGNTLEDLLTTAGKLRKHEALLYIMQILSGVSYIHKKKILHLDINPSNILIEEKSQKATLIDFGSSIRYRLNNETNAEIGNLIAASNMHYVPVEQETKSNQKHFEPSFDTYAVGATLYYMLTGSPPPLAIFLVTKKAMLTPPSLASASAEINRYLDKIVNKALSVSRADRYYSAEKMNDDLGKENQFAKRLNTIEYLINGSMVAEASAKIVELEEWLGDWGYLVEDEKSIILNAKEKQKEKDGILLKPAETYEGKLRQLEQEQSLSCDEEKRNINSRKIINDLKSGYLNLIVSLIMKVGRKENVCVEIFKKKKILDEVKSKENIHEIKVGNTMKVKLIGPDFEIIPINTEEQAIEKDEKTIWVWRVKPLKHGKKDIEVLVTFPVRINSQEKFKDYPVFNKQITVKINPAYSGRKFMEKYWQWLLGTLIGTGLLWKVLEDFIFKKSH